jgi:hypothetical protein
MKNSNPTMQLKSPVELAAFLITRCSDSAKSEAQLETVDRMIDNFIKLYGLRVAKELRGYVEIRREELRLETKIKSNNKKLYDTHNWLRSLGNSTADSSVSVLQAAS